MNTCTIISSSALFVAFQFIQLLVVGDGMAQERTWQSNTADLQLAIEATGKTAADAVEYGLVELKTCTSNAGEMTVKKNEFSFDDPTQKYIKVTRDDNSFMSDHPKNGVRVVLDFKHPEDDVKKFTVVEGQFKIKTGGDRETIKIADAAKMAGQDVENEKLKSLGVTVSIKQDGNSLALELNGNHQPVTSVSLSDADGKKLKGQIGSGWSGGGDLMNYDFQFEDSIPDDATFFVVIAENLEEVTVPFQLTDLKMPKKRK